VHLTDIKETAKILRFTIRCVMLTATASLITVWSGGQCRLKPKWAPSPPKGRNFPQFSEDFF